MSSYALLAWSVLLVIIPSSSGNGGGAPKSACVDMTPNHGVDPPRDACPYTLQVDGDLIKSTNILKVCVVGKAFKGLMMQMRAVGDKVPVGTFNGTKGSLPEDTKLMQCTAVDDTITHKRSSLKPSPTCFYWKASENDVTDKLQFVATIVDTKPMYWVKITSDIINTKPTTPVEQVTTIPKDPEVVAGNATFAFTVPTATNMGGVGANATRPVEATGGSAAAAILTTEPTTAATTSTTEATTTSITIPIAETASETTSPSGSSTEGNDTLLDNIRKTMQELAGQSRAITPDVVLVVTLATCSLLARLLQ